MSKIIYMVVLCEDFEGSPPVIYPERCFLTEDAARSYALSKHPEALTDGFEYTWPDDGTKSWRAYWIDPIVLEED